MNVKETGIPVHVEIMVPLVGNHKELRYQKNIIDQTAEKVFAERNDRLEYMVGTMIEFRVRQSPPTRSPKSPNSSRSAPTT